MIVEYHRPKSLQDAQQLLGRKVPYTIPLAGGTVVNQPSSQAIAVVDLQDLGLNIILQHGNAYEVGATVTLQELLSSSEAGKISLPADLFLAIEKEASFNLRQVASLAGTLVSADGRSPLATTFLAMDASLTLLTVEESISLGELFPVRKEKLRARLITRVSVPTHVRLAYESVARSPADRPIVCAAAAVWPSGRTRLCLGGFGDAPILAMDGTEAIGAEAAARSAYAQAGDQWASAAYRQEMAGILASRCFQRIS